MELAAITANKIIAMFVIGAIGMICYKAKLLMRERMKNYRMFFFYWYHHF